jgi:hypothetical protein
VTDESRDYRLAPSFRVRLMGAGLMGLGVILVVATVIVVSTGLSLDVLSVFVILTVPAVFVLGYLLNKRTVLHTDPIGYRVRMVRGVGAEAARWADVHDLQTAEVAGSRCLVLNLRDGRSSTVPVDVVEGDPDELVRDLTALLDHAQGTKSR